MPVVQACFMGQVKLPFTVTVTVTVTVTLKGTVKVTVKE